MSAHFYSDTQLRNDEVRLVNLLPGQWQDPIRCEMKQVSLAEKPHYYALSYVWGSTGVKRQISLNDHPFAVTVNLEGALRYLRLHHEQGLVLWIDAICVDQKNDQERTHQVNLMGQIYQSCTQAIVYLGDDIVDYKPRKRVPSAEKFSADENDIARVEKTCDKIVHLLGHDGCTHSNTQWREDATSEFTATDVFALVRKLGDDIHLQSMSPFLAKGSSDEAQTALIEALRRLMNPPWTPWWTRIWVVQEAAMPTDMLMIYGCVSAPWKIFSDAASNISKHSRTCCADFVDSRPRDLWRVLADFCGQVNGIQELRLALSNTLNVFYEERQSMTLLHLLQKFRNRRASDPRDKVYALLSLARSNGKSPKIIPDYTMGEREVYIKTTLEIISDTQSIAVLSTENGRKFRNDLPSWVPDWNASSVQSHDLRAKAVHLYGTFGLTEVPNYHSTDQATLAVWAVRLGDIEGVEEVMWGDSLEVSGEILSNWWQAFENRCQEAPEVRRKVGCFWKLVCADIFCWQSPSEPQGKVRRLTRKDEITFVSWAIQSTRSHFMTSVLESTGTSYSHNVATGALSDLAKVWECLLYLETNSSVRSIEDLWGTNTTSAQAVEDLLRDTSHNDLKRLVRAFRSHWSELDMFSASEDIKDAPWMEFFQAIYKEMCNYYGRNWVRQKL